MLLIRMGTETGTNEIAHFTIAVDLGGSARSDPRSHGFAEKGRRKRGYNNEGAPEALSTHGCCEGAPVDNSAHG